MEKDKGLFPFRKHPVGNFLDGKKGRKRKGGRLRRSMGFLLAVALIFNTLPASGLAVSASGREAGLCEHHRSHTPDCGYREAQPCTHEHTEEKHSGEECYKIVTECVHTHTDGCYPETEESTGEGNATPSDAGNREPSLCTHVCSEESGCITKILDCHHEHDESCGYQEAQECGYACEICNGTEPEDTGESTENTEDAGTDTAECICETLCTEDSINGGCPVCGADDASLLDCKGKVSEENTGEQEDTGICKHHQEHDADCGYIPKSEDGEGSPCTYECRICPVEDLIADLPDKVTKRNEFRLDNAEEVRAQLDKILALYRELNEDEQEEINLSRIYALQGALDGANAPMTADGHTEQQDTDEASVTTNGETRYYATLGGAFDAANGKTAIITMLTDAECVHSGSDGSPLNINGGNVTLNLNGKTLSGKGYGYYGIIDVSGGSLLVQGEDGEVRVARRGLSCRESGKLTVEGITLELVGDDIVVASAGVDNEGGAVVLNGTQMTGEASSGQIYQYSGTTTINNVTATGTTENFPKSVWYYNEGTLKINGGTFDKIVVDSENYGGVKSVAELLGEGCAYKKQDGTWATADELTGWEISNVTVKKIPLTINPQRDESWYYGDPNTLAMNAAPVDSGNDNMADAAGTVDVKISAVAKAELDGAVIGYYDESNLASAFAAENTGATVTLLKDVELSNYIQIKNTTFMLDLNGHNISKTDDCAISLISGANLTICGSGKVTGYVNTVIVTSGATLTLEGGNFSSSHAQGVGVKVQYGGALNVTGAGVKISNLCAQNNTTVSLTAGTYDSIEVDSSGTLASLLAENCAYYSGSTPVLLSELEGKTELTGPVTVKECQHTGVEAINNNDGTHSVNCPYCGYTSENEPHNFTATGYCPACKLQAAAKVEKDSSATSCVEASRLNAAFADSGNAGATFTLLSDVEPSTYLTIQIDCTLDLGGHTITSGIGRGQCVNVQTNTAVTIRGEGEIIAKGGIALAVNGSVTLEGGTYTSGGDESSSVYVVGQSAMLSVTGEKVSIRNTSGGYGLSVAQAQSVRLSAGTYSGTTEAISSTVKLSDMLAHMDNIRYAYYQGDALVTTGLDGQALTGTVTVKVCDHTGDGVCEYTPNENDASTHTKTCLACGYAETGDCGFEKTADPTADSHTGQCPLCKRNRSGAHSFSEWSGNPVARACTVCGYEQTAVAKVEKSNGGDTEYMTAKGLNTVFAYNSGYEDATVTLLDDVTITEAAARPRINIRCTLNLNGHTIRSDAVGAPPLEVSGYGNVTITGSGEIVSNSNEALYVLGTVVLEGGTFYSGVAYSGAVVVMSGNLSVTGENVVMENTGNNGYGLFVNDNAKSVQLSAGTYSGAARAISVSGSFTLDDLLNQKGTSRVAYYKDNATLVTEGLDGQTLPSGSYTVRVCTHAYRYTHTTGATTHSQTCPACGDAKAAETCSYDAATGRCACGSTLAVTLPADLALTYDGTAKTPAVTVTVDGTELAAEKYQINYDNNINAGNTAKVTVTAANGSFSGSASTTFSIGKASLTVTASDQTITYGGSIATGTDQVTPAGLVGGDTLESVTLTPSSDQVAAADKTITPSGAKIQNSSGTDVTGNYKITYMPGTLTINQAQGTLTVPAGPVAKTFGDGQFLLGCSTNGDGKISYASSDENVASVSTDGNVLIKGAGEAVITVSLADGSNYTGAESQKVQITVAKAAALTIPGETRNYTYLNGSHGAVNIDVAGKLPKDRGETTYTAATTDGKGILSGVFIDQDGKLVYIVEGNKAAGDTAVITVTAVMANYGDTAYAVTIELVEKKTVEPQDGGSVSVKDGCILTYGQTLSDLTLENVIFVEQGTQKQVEGTLAWSNPSHVPEVADRTAQWVFTPKDNKEYEQLTGTAAITVVKATPDTEAPEAAAVTYHPAGTLGSVGLNGGGAAWTVGGSAVTVEGTWGWKEPSAIPAVKNSGYTAVFTPEDTANYDTVERTVAVTVAKAEPYIATPPTAAQITYGDALDASALTGGTVQYSSSDSTAVTGSFAWKDGSIKPDSGSAAYTVVFTPADSTDYSSVETQVMLVTGKAENAPDMPPSAMDVARRFEKVGDVGLPKGWQWQDTDRDTALEIGVPVTATAVYTGADRDNYRNVTVSVAITRADCDHEHIEIRNAVTATCQRKGYTGDTWCLDCGELLAKGTETDLADHSGGTATCISGKVCQVCGTEYTGKDGANHMHTEIRGAIKAGCTSDGYTGDTYCTDCGAKTGSGRAFPAVGHDWHVTREEAATTASEGRRIYTCGECGQTREESIPKLPQPSHTHSYSPRETKAATCTENGVLTYNCSCGDSYSQNTAALGHSYRSEVTKQPTISAEGVMTYTCDRCRHSYTRPIAKLPDTETQQPGTEQPGETEPGNGSTETRPDTGIPFIKDEDGKTGWDVIRAEEEKAEEGSTINVDMNGTTVVPGDIFDSIKGKDITVTFDMGNGILWSVNGKEVITNKAGDIDFSVKTGTSMIPVDIVNNVTGERYSIQISLAHEGEFGFTAVLSIGLGKENAGYTASLYYYNQSIGELEFICADTVAEDGTVSLAFTHASDYVIAIDGDGEEESGNAAEPEQPDTPDKDSTGQAESPKTGQAWRPWRLIVFGALVIIMGIGVFFVVRKKQETENS